MVLRLCTVVHLRFDCRNMRSWVAATAWRMFAGERSIRASGQLAAFRNWLGGGCSGMAR